MRSARGCLEDTVVADAFLELELDEIGFCGVTGGKIESLSGEELEGSRRVEGPAGSKAPVGVTSRNELLLIRVFKIEERTDGFKGTLAPVVRGVGLIEIGEEDIERDLPVLLSVLVERHDGPEHRSVSTPIDTLMLIRARLVDTRLLVSVARVIEVDRDGLVLGVCGGELDGGSVEKIGPPPTDDNGDPWSDVDLPRVV